MQSLKDEGLDCVWDGDARAQREAQRDDNPEGRW